MRRALVFTVAFLALAVGSIDLSYAGGCAPTAGTSEGKGVEVKLAKCGFLPTILHAPVGATVTWFNGDYLPHAVNGLGWNATPAGEVTNPGINVSHTFSQPGIYPYMCYVHPGMAGVIVVGDVALNPNADGGMRLDAMYAPAAPKDGTAPAASTPSAPSLELPIAIALMLAAAALGYAARSVGALGLTRGAPAIRRRHGIHAR